MSDTEARQVFNTAAVTSTAEGVREGPGAAFVPYDRSVLEAAMKAQSLSIYNQTFAAVSRNLFTLCRGAGGIVVYSTTRKHDRTTVVLVPGCTLRCARKNCTYLSCFSDNGNLMAVVRNDKDAAPTMLRMSDLVTRIRGICYPCKKLVPGAIRQGADFVAKVLLARAEIETEAAAAAANDVSVDEGDSDAGASSAVPPPPLRPRLRHPGPVPLRRRHLARSRRRRTSLWQGFRICP